MDLKIDSEFQSLIPPLRAEEFKQLEANLKMDGCTHPIVTWNKKILDGHNRYEICTRHNIPFDIDERKFSSREDAMDWIDRNQTGRRNLSKDDYYEILGRIYNRTKKAAHRPKKGVPNEHVKHERTATAIAKEFDVSESTVRRAGKFAEAVESVRKNEPEITGQGREAVIQTAKDRTKRTEPKKERPRKEVDEEKDACQPKTSWAMDYAEMAISQLERINRNDPKRIEALSRVISWTNKEIKS